MAEYIEREAVMKIIDDYGCTHGGTLGSHSGAVDVVGSAIYKLPAADVVPVVHCKNCEYNNECSVQDFGEMHQNDFCSHGKRKELDNDT